MISDALFKEHILRSVMFPEQDSEQWIAYLILKQKYPSLTYWSMDGYSCDALADYDKGLVWKDNTLIDWESKQTIEHTTKMFWDCTTEEIVNTWMQLNGETRKTKREWLNRMKTATGWKK